MVFPSTVQLNPSPFFSQGCSIFENHPRNMCELSVDRGNSLPADLYTCFFPWTIVWNLASLWNPSWMSSFGLFTNFFVSWSENKHELRTLSSNWNPSFPIKPRTESFNLALCGLWSSNRIRFSVWMASRFCDTHVNAHLLSACSMFIACYSFLTNGIFGYSGRSHGLYRWYWVWYLLIVTKSADVQAW